MASIGSAEFKLTADNKDFIRALAEIEQKTEQAGGGLATSFQRGADKAGREIRNLIGANLKQLGTEAQRTGTDIGEGLRAGVVKQTQLFQSVVLQASQAAQKVDAAFDAVDLTFKTKGGEIIPAAELAKLGRLNAEFGNAQRAIQQFSQSTVGANSSVGQFIQTLARQEIEAKKANIALTDPKGAQALDQKAQRLKVVEQYTRQVAQAQQLLANGQINIQQYDKLLERLKNIKDIRLNTLKQEFDNLEGGASEAGNAATGLKESFNSLAGGVNVLQGVFQGIGIAITNAVVAPFRMMNELLQQSVSKFAEFDQTVRRTLVMADEGASKYGQLSRAIFDVATSTSAAPDSIAQMSTELSRAGFTVDETTKLLGPLVKAAEVTGTEFELMSEVATESLRAFKIPTEEAGYAIDILAKGANASNTDIRGLGESLSYSASTAYAVGVPMQDLVATIGLLANAGVKGSRSGTALAYGLNRLVTAAQGADIQTLGLTAATDRQVEAFRALGAEVTDANGKLLPLDQVLLKIKKGMVGLNTGEQLSLTKLIFGEEAGRSFLTLLSSSDAEISKMFNTIRNSKGTVDAAQKDLQTFARSVAILQANMQALQVTIGGVISVVLKPLVDITNLVLGAFNKLPGPIKSLVVALGLLATAWVTVRTAQAAWAIASQTQLGVAIAAQIAQVKLLGTTIGSSLAADFVKAKGAAAAAANTFKLLSPNLLGMANAIKAINFGQLLQGMLSASKNATSLNTALKALGFNQTASGVRVLSSNFQSFGSTLLQTIPYGDKFKGVLGNVSKAAGNASTFLFGTKAATDAANVAGKTFLSNLGPLPKALGAAATTAGATSTAYGALGGALKASGGTAAGVSTQYGTLGKAVLGAGSGASTGAMAFGPLKGAIDAAGASAGIANPALQGVGNAAAAAGSNAATSGGLIGKLGLALKGLGPSAVTLGLVTAAIASVGLAVSVAYGILQKGHQINKDTNKYIADTDAALKKAGVSFTQTGKEGDVLTRTLDSMGGAWGAVARLFGPVGVASKSLVDKLKELGSAWQNTYKQAQDNRAFIQASEQVEAMDVRIDAANKEVLKLGGGLGKLGDFSGAAASELKKQVQVQTILGQNTGNLSNYYKVLAEQEAQLGNKEASSRYLVLSQSMASSARMTQANIDAMTAELAKRGEVKLATESQKLSVEQLTSAYNANKAAIDIVKQQQQLAIQQQLAQGTIDQADATVKLAGIEANAATQQLSAAQQRLAGLDAIRSKRAFTEDEEKQYAQARQARDQTQQQQIQAEINLRNQVITYIQNQITAEANLAKKSVEAAQQRISAESAYQSLLVSNYQARGQLIDAQASKEVALINQRYKGIDSKQKELEIANAELAAIERKAAMQPAIEQSQVRQLQLKYADKALAIDLASIEAQRNLLIAQRTGDTQGIALAQTELGLLTQQKAQLDEQYKLELNTLGIQQQAERTQINAAGIQKGRTGDVIAESGAAANTAASWKGVYEATKAAAGATTTLSTNVGTVKQETEKAKGNIDGAKQSVDQVTTATQAAATAVGGVNTAWSTVPATTQQAQSAVDGYKTKIGEVPASIDQIGASWTKNSDAIKGVLGTLSTEVNNLKANIGNVLPTVNAFRSAAVQLGRDMQTSYKNSETAIRGVVQWLQYADTWNKRATSSAYALASAYAKAASAAQSLANAKGGKALGGPVSPGQTWAVNEYGMESFMSSTGDLSLIKRSAWSRWRPPSQGTVIPAGMTKTLASMGAFEQPKRPSLRQAPNGAISTSASIARALKSMGPASQITNNVTLETKNPVADTGRVLVEMARARRRVMR